jgi:hypothetical protein
MNPRPHLPRGTTCFLFQRVQRRMAGGLMRSFGVWVLAWLLTAPFAWAADSHSPEALALVRSSVDRWPQSRSLASAFELQKVRWARRADDPAAKWLKLELRFVTQDTDQDLEDRRFVDVLKQFQEANGTSLAESLLYKLVHLADVKRSDAQVSIAVLEHTYALERDPDSGRMIFGPTFIRQLRRTVALPGWAEVANSRRQQASVPGTVQPGVLRDLVESFLQDFFARKNSEAGLPAPQLLLKPLEPDFVGMEVFGIRKLVIPDSKFWEHLEISIDLDETAQGRRAVCHLDGGYAPGVFGWGGLPAADGYTDIMNEYRSDLERFADMLMRALQEHLAHVSR